MPRWPWSPQSARSPLFSQQRFPRAPHIQQSKPKVRAITAFVRLEPAHYQEQIQQTLKFLRGAKSAFEKSGYEVETIRITTQPFPEYTRGMTDEQVLAFFRDYDALAVREKFDAAIGPAMMSDTDDPHQAELLAKIIANSKTLEGSVFIAGEDGIHWKSIHAAAGVIKYLEANTPHSQGNFNFTAASLVPSGTPFYPASYFTGEGKQFAIGLESANVVSEVFASTKSPNEAEQQLKTTLGDVCHRNRKNRGSDQQRQRLEIRRPGPITGAADGCFHRPRD